MRSISFVKKALAAVLLMVLIIGIAMSYQLTYAKLSNATFTGTQKTILCHKYATITGQLDKNLNLGTAVKPYLYDRSDQFDATFTVTPKWDGYALAAAYVPAVLEIYKSTNPQYSGDIISKRPTLVGLIAVFKGSHHEKTIGKTIITDDYKLLNGKLYLHIAIRSVYYTYSVTVYTRNLVEQKVEESAWLVARAGISAKLKLFNFINAGFQLASVEAGVKAQITNVVETESGYKVTVQFGIPTYEILVSYMGQVKVEEIYNAVGPGPVPTSISKGLMSTTMEINYYTLNALGSYSAYSDYMDMCPYTGYHEFNAGGTENAVIFTKA